MKLNDPQCPTIHPLATRAPRRRSGSRRHRRPAVGGLGRSRKPPACAEGTDGVFVVGKVVVAKTGIQEFKDAFERRIEAKVKSNPQKSQRPFFERERREKRERKSKCQKCKVKFLCFFTFEFFGYFGCPFASFAFKKMEV